MAEAFTLNPNPTFKATVDIPQPGDNAAPGKLTFTFKHYSLKAYKEKLEEHQAELAAFSEDMDALPCMAQFIQHIAEGWALEDEFNEENIIRLLTNYGRAYQAVTATYFLELMGVRAKN